MINLILQHVLSEVEANDYATAVAKLNDKNILVRNPKHWTIGDLTTVVGTEGAAVVAYTIEKAGTGDSPQAALFRGAFLAVNNTGLQLHTDDRQVMIDQLALAGGWPAPLTTAVKEAGVKAYSIMSQANLADATEDSVKTAYDTHLAELAARAELEAKAVAKSNMINSVNTLYNTYVAGYIDSNDVLDKAALVQKFRDVATELEK